jgi:hypothetical protein
MGESLSVDDFLRGMLVESGKAEGGSHVLVVPKLAMDAFKSTMRDWFTFDRRSAGKGSKQQYTFELEELERRLQMLPPAADPLLKALGRGGRSSLRIFDPYTLSVQKEKFSDTRPWRCAICQCCRSRLSPSGSLKRSGRKNTARRGPKAHLALA